MSSTFPCKGIFRCIRKPRRHLNSCSKSEEKNLVPLISNENSPKYIVGKQETIINGSAQVDDNTLTSSVMYPVPCMHGFCSE